ncbi:unnamed protein product [Peniophora sp. CBMAI 1063]|nr:unnamed protein product [Peniophora sp. CBMAI 1063]
MAAIRVKSESLEVENLLRTRGRQDPANFRFMLANLYNNYGLNVGVGWDTDPPFEYTYRFPGSGHGRFTIGDVIKYYPLYKGWDQSAKIPTTQSYIPPDEYCWYGIITDYTTVVKREDGSEGGSEAEGENGSERGEEDGTDDEQQEYPNDTKGVVAVGVIWLYSQSEMQEIYDGKMGVEKLPYRGDKTLQKLAKSTDFGPKDRFLSFDDESMKMGGLICTVPVQDVGINDSPTGKIKIRFDQPWLSFDEATRERKRNGEIKNIPAKVSMKRVDVDLTPLKDEWPEMDGDMDVDED